MDDTARAWSNLSRAAEERVVEHLHPLVTSTDPLEAWIGFILSEEVRSPGATIDPASGRLAPPLLDEAAIALLLAGEAEARGWVQRTTIEVRDRIGRDDRDHDLALHRRPPGVRLVELEDRPISPLQEELLGAVKLLQLVPAILVAFNGPEQRPRRPQLANLLEAVVGGRASVRDYLKEIDGDATFVRERKDLDYALFALVRLARGEPPARMFSLQGYHGARRVAVVPALWLTRIVFAAFDDYKMGSPRAAKGQAEHVYDTLELLGYPKRLAAKWTERSDDLALIESAWKTFLEKS